MAVTYTPFPDGESLATLRTTLNTFNNAVKVNIASIESDVTALETETITKDSVGMVYLTDGTMPTASLTTTYQKVGMVNTTSVNQANGHITVDNVLYAYTINTTGIYKLTFSGGMVSDVGDLITFNYNINGSSAVTNPPQFIGDGSKVVSINNSVIMSLTAGAVIYIEAKSDSTSDMTPKNCGFMIEKSHY